MNNRDKRIGKYGEYEPEVCAVTEQNCSGQHATHYSVGGGGYYIAILDKAGMKMSNDDIEALRKRFRSLIPKSESRIRATGKQKSQQEES